MKIKPILSKMIIVSTIIITYCSNPNESKNLIIFHAGSLSVPFAAMKKDFEENNKDIKVLLEASGSIQAARKITDLKKPCDIIASADDNVIDNYLVPSYADWNITFASNQLVLCYTEKSKFAREISDKNWFNILKKKGVRWGHSDPNLDPCGYRALMVVQLAEKYYNMPGLYAGVLANRPVENIRPKSVDLLSLLQTENLDYAWEYRSVAIQHGLKYVSLPEEINLGNRHFDGNYAKAKVRVAGEKKGSWIDMKGESCTYGVALLKSSPNRKAAVRFLAYMLDPEKGLAIFKKQGQPPIIPSRVRDAGMKKLVPAELQKYISTDD